MRIVATGKDGVQYSDENILFCATDRFFTNSTALFISYYDILNIPWYTYLTIIRDNQKMYDILDLEPLRYMNAQELLAWYVNRKFYNPLIDLWKGNKDEGDMLNDFLYKEMASERTECLFTNIYDVCTISDFLDQVIKQRFCEKIFIFTDEKNPNIENSVKTTYGKDIEFLYGNLEKCLEELPIDTTYLFHTCDIYEALLKTNHLDFSSVGLPYEYQYNIRDGNVRYDIPRLTKHYTFKYCFFNALRANKVSQKKP